MSKKLYTLDEAADEIGISKRSLQYYITKGDIVVRYLGENLGCTRILEADLDAFLANLPTQKPAKAAS